MPNLIPTTAPVLSSVYKLPKHCLMPPGCGEKSKRGGREQVCHLGSCISSIWHRKDTRITYGFCRQLSRWPDLSFLQVPTWVPERGCGGDCGWESPHLSWSLTSMLGKVQQRRPADGSSGEPTDVFEKAQHVDPATQMARLYGDGGGCPAHPALSPVWTQQARCRGEGERERVCRPWPHPLHCTGGGRGEKLWVDYKVNIFKRKLLIMENVRHKGRMEKNRVMAPINQLH